ncbi:hypothetical protein [Sanguibacter sp. Z1732]|uniref:hypothetical protein n=1 Tax=Sanguibacter sp. Z1732 TaxID=3435412 RepID=UPI003D9CAA68
MTYLDELRRIDPAGPADSAAHKRPEAQRLAEQIMAHPVEPATIRRQGSRRILLLAGAAAAAVVGALVFVPGLTGDDAYATWTAVPTPASADVSSAAAEACSMLMGEVNAAAESASGSPTAVPGSSDAEIVEQRGVFTYVVLHLPLLARAAYLRVTLRTQPRTPARSCTSATTTSRSQMGSVQQS